MSLHKTPPERNYTKDEEDIRHIRTVFDLPYIVPGVRQCLKCDRNFFSENVRAIRVCDPCKHATEGTKTIWG